MRYKLKKTDSFGAQRAQLFLCKNSGGIECEVIGGPFQSTNETDQALLAYLISTDYDEQDDVMFLLEIQANNPKFHSYSGGFMDRMRKKAGRQ